MISVTDDVLKKEYAANGVNVPSELEANMMKAAKALTDTKQMKVALKALSEAMLDRYKSEMALIDASVTVDRKSALAAMQQKDREDEDKSRHLLSNVLTRFETDHGFNSFVGVNGHPRIIQMTGLLTAEDFIGTVGAGHMAKDYVTVDHGVYSHRIQWYCLGKSGVFDADLKGLYVSFQTGNAWLLTFDRRNEHPRAATGDGNIDTHDFRTPEKLHAYLKSSDALAECPLVAQYIQDKNKAIQGKSWLLVRKVVAARKLFPADKSKFDGWKAMKSSDIEGLLKSKLTESQRKELELFLKSSNVLYPQSDGTYAKTAQA
jgi:hypothetical protein